MIKKIFARLMNISFERRNLKPSATQEFNDKLKLEQELARERQEMNRQHMKPIYRENSSVDTYEPEKKDIAA